MFIAYLFNHDFSSNRTHVDLVKSSSAIYIVQLADTQGQAMQILTEYTQNLSMAVSEKTELTQMMDHMHQEGSPAPQTSLNDLSETLVVLHKWVDLNN